MSTLRSKKNSIDISTWQNAGVARATPSERASEPRARAFCFFNARETSTHPSSSATRHARAPCAHQPDVPTTYVEPER